MTHPTGGPLSYTTTRDTILPAHGVSEVWDGEHWAAAQAAALGERPRLAVITEPAVRREPQGRIELAGDYDVDSVDLSRYDVDRAAR